jgi:hypothetical protein
VIAWYADDAAAGKAVAKPVDGGGQRQMQIAGADDDIEAGGGRMARRIPRVAGAVLVQVGEDP